MSAAVYGWRLVLDRAWREELVLYRDTRRCTATVVHADGRARRCARTATAVVEVVGHGLDPRDPAASAASCEPCARESWSHAPTRGGVSVR